MPEYRTQEAILDIARNAMLIDTNVLIAAFCPDEDPGRQELAQYMLHQQDERPLLVPSAVVVEAWGLLVGSRRHHSAGLELLLWLNSPNRATIVPPHPLDVQVTHALVAGLHIDCVDAMLAELATHITVCCELQPALRIATFDTRDFTRMLAAQELRFTVFDMRSWDDLTIDM